MSSIDLNDVVLGPCAGSTELVMGDVLETNYNKKIAYVRFRGMDKRLDSWIPYEKLEFVSKGVRESKSSTKRKKRDASGKVKIQGANLIRNLDTIQYGDMDIDCWYYSPYPVKYTKNRHLYICDQCLMYFKNEADFLAHGHSVHNRRPPGREIYRYGKLSMFEVVGCEHKLFCQCLSLLSKLFLDDVAVFYNVSQFIFFVLCECDENGAHIVSFFSRDINWLDKNILACILVLPPFQREGYGRLMISIAYEMARRAGINGSPEKPLSDLGKKAFTAYWRETIIFIMFQHAGKIKKVDDFSTISSITKTDLLKVMREMNLLYYTKDDGWTNSLNIEVMNEWVKNGDKPVPPKIPFFAEYLTWLDNRDGTI